LQIYTKVLKNNLTQKLFNLRDIDSVNIFGLNISKISYEEFLVYIESSISGKVKRVIGYANADTLNKINKYEQLKDIFSGFDLIHPDGIGVFLASGLLKGKEGLKVRFTGSDIYPVLIDRSIKNNWSYFFSDTAQKSSTLYLPDIQT